MAKFQVVILRAVQVGCVLFNFALALIDFRAKHYGAGAFSLFCALIVVAVMVASAIANKKHRAAIAELRQRHAEMVLGLEGRVMGPEVEAMAYENLTKVVKAVGGEWIDTHRIFFNAGGYKFRIEPNALYRMGIQTEGTCIQNGGIHTFEVMASAILLLRHNPALFDMWRLDQGHPYG